MSELLAVGISHKTAPVALRERLALPGGRASEFLRELVADHDVHEAVAISTCNRTEVYLVVGDPVAAESAVLGMLARRADIRPTELIDSIYALRNCDVARHLFRVTAGLESMIVGEAEVQGQVKQAYELALAERTSGPLLNRLFREALAAGKRVRSETAIGELRVSVASVAVKAARDTLGDLSARHVLILGAGETAELTARALAEEGVRTLFVANRHRARALGLARRFGGGTAQLEQLPDELERADIMVASTASPHTILGAEELALVMAARKGRPLLLIDIAVPRDIEAACGEIPGVTLLDIDDLQRVTARNRSVRQGEARRAEAIIESEIERFADWLGELEALPTVAALREHGTAVARRVLEENAGRWESASDGDLERIERLAHAIVTRLLHEPTRRMRAATDARRHARMQAVRELFGLEDAAPDLAGERPAAEVHELPRRGQRRRV